ncbi:DUF502 domain-containing protein [Alkalisalibacterium limincola]|uniref:DUF502 domain-containing protein n=1 Tax=Alkalisalibacterium limincola TaxID=2699169 RepID=UPI002AA2B507|nr:DUF502 domain-containing protein [Alkalisalibacterium limincola]
MSSRGSDPWREFYRRARALRIPHLQRYVLTGLLTVFPVWLTWIVFSFVLRQLSRLGQPIVDAMLAVFAWMIPGGHIVQQEWIRFTLAVLLTLAFLYGLGWLANRVVGRQLLTLIDSLFERIPLVQTIYGGTKKLLTMLQKKPESTQRVVLIDFPKENMKVVGLVTRILHEEGTGRELAAVYVPTTPNPTSGYLEIVPVEQLTPTPWTVDQAMAFIISGGAVSPDEIPFTPPKDKGGLPKDAPDPGSPSGDPVTSAAGTPAEPGPALDPPEPPLPPDPEGVRR